MSAADADGGSGGGKAHLVAVAFADQSGDRTQAALHHVQDDIVSLRLVFGEAVGRHFQLRARAHHYFAAIDELDPRIGFGLGCQHIALLHFGLDREHFGRLAPLHRENPGKVGDLAGRVRVGHSVEQHGQGKRKTEGQALERFHGDLFSQKECQALTANSRFLGGGFVVRFLGAIFLLFLFLIVLLLFLFFLFFLVAGG